MYQGLEKIILKTGEAVEAGVVIGPDAEWRDRILELLKHKPPIYNWQNAELLTEDVGVEVRFTILHRDGTPLSHMMTTTLQGVGIFGHVWTVPAERQNGAASLLMDRLMQHFQDCSGQALFLGTGYDSHAYHIYRRRGFESIEPGQGLMRFSTQEFSDFEAGYFAPGPTEVLPLDWRHWPTLPALFTGDFPGGVRNAALKLYGRTLTEGPMLPLIQSERARRHEEAPHALVLQNKKTGAAVALATQRPDPMWPNRCLVDLYCHPNFWTESSTLLAELPLPTGKRLVAYADASCLEQCNAFREAGFQTVATLPRWLPTDFARSDYADVILLERL